MMKTSTLSGLFLVTLAIVTATYVTPVQARHLPAQHFSTHIQRNKSEEKSALAPLSKHEQASLIKLVRRLKNSPRSRKPTTRGRLKKRAPEAELLRILYTLERKWAMTQLNEKVAREFLRIYGRKEQ